MTGKTRLQWQNGLILAVALLCGAASAMNYSVPYVRHNLDFRMDTLGYGSTIGLLEVENGGDNGISFYSQSPEWGLQTFMGAQDFADGNPAGADSAHGTLIAHVMGNLFTYNNTTNVPYEQSLYYTPWSVGMAPRARYYGALFDGADTKAAFLSLQKSLDYLTSTSGVQAINCSWGGIVQSRTDLNGLSANALLLDEYAGYFGKTGGRTGRYQDVLMVIAAGNTGGLLNQPADAYNGLTVGALDVGSRATTYIDDPDRQPIPRVASFSSWQPLADGRCGVNVVAPGSWIAIVEHFVVGSNGSTLTIRDLDGVLGDGTSFATPHVTGEAALLYSAPYHPQNLSGSVTFIDSSTLKGQVFSRDHKLIKAMIINSADKIGGLDVSGAAQSAWLPGLTVVGADGVTNAVAPLNYAVGAGQANAEEARLTYFESGNRLWDVDTLTESGQQISYVYGSDTFTNAVPDSPVIRLTATLTWDRHVDFDVDTDPENVSAGTLERCLLSNLDLILQREISPGVWSDIYRSVSTVDNVEHIFIDTLPSSERYRLSVVATDLADPSAGEQYALAVSYLPIPEPSSLLLSAALAAGVLLRIRFRRNARIALDS